MVKMIQTAKPEIETTNIPENSPFRQRIHALVTGAFYNLKPDSDKKVNRFEVVVMVCIVLNMF
jgi:hypothetical protein